MDAFFLAALAATAISLLVLLSTADVRKAVIHVQNPWFAFSIPRRAANLVAFILALFLLVAILVMMVSSLHPRDTPVYTVGQFFLGRRFFGTVVGFLFGFLFAFWIRQLLVLKPDQPVTWAHRIEGILLVCLLAVGGFSNELGSLIRRINSVSAAGVSLSFESARVAAGERGQQGASATSSRGDNLAAFVLLSDIQGFVKRDEGFIAAIAAAEKPAPAVTPPQNPPAAKNSEAQDNKPQNNKTQESKITAPPGLFYAVDTIAQCLQGMASDGGDRTSVQRRLEPLRMRFRDIMVRRDKLSDAQIAQVAQDVVATSMAIVDDLGSVYLPLPEASAETATRKAIAEGCKQLLTLRCAGETADIDLDRPKTDLSDSLGKLARAASACRQAHETVGDDGRMIVTPAVRKLAEEFGAAVRGPDFFTRPYMTILYASLLLQLGEHRIAAKEVEDWIAAAGQPGDPASKWYVIRARISLSIILDEWIRAQIDLPVVLLEYHIDNIEKTMNMLGNMKLLTAAWKEFSGGRDMVADGMPWPSWDGECKLSADPETRKAQYALASTYLSQHLMYGHRATQHREYFDRYSSKVRGRRANILKLNLACVREMQDVVAADLLYAQVLQVYAEIELANASRVAEIPDHDTVKGMLERTQMAATRGIEIVRKYARQEQEAATSAFKAMAPQQASELRDQFISLRARARDGLQK